MVSVNLYRRYTTVISRTCEVLAKQLFMGDKPDSSVERYDRRDYYRIDDEVYLRVESSDLQSAHSGSLPAAFAADNPANLMRELQRIDYDNAQLMHSFSDDNRELELYLKGINKKIDLIANQITAAADKQHHIKTQAVSLSEGGISFASNDPRAVDSILAMQITLLPSHHCVMLFGRVIHCQSRDNGYTVATAFVALKDQDRQVLARHIMQAQLNARRQQNNPTSH